MNSMVPVPGGPPSPETDIVWNLLLGTLFATVGALVNRLVGRRAGPGPR
jgi:hypothetical protein